MKSKIWVLIIVAVAAIVIFMNMPSKKEAELPSGSYIKFRVSGDAIAYSKICGQLMSGYGKTADYCNSVDCANSNNNDTVSYAGGTSKLWILNETDLCLCDSNQVSGAPSLYSMNDSDAPINGNLILDSVNSYSLADETRCKPISCNQNSNCGTDGYFGENICEGLNLFNEMAAYTCINPGMTGSYCRMDISLYFNETCSRLCRNGACTIGMNYTSFMIYKDRYVQGSSFSEFIDAANAWVETNE